MCSFIMPCCASNEANKILKLENIDLFLFVSAALDMYKLASNVNGNNHYILECVRNNGKIYHLPNTDKYVDDDVIRWIEELKLEIVDRISKILEV